MENYTKSYNERPEPASDVVDYISKAYPALATELMRAARSRSAQLTQPGSELRLGPINSLLTELESTANAWRESGNNALFPLARLLERTRRDIVIGLDGALAGMIGTTINRMRDVMEIELLLRDFALDKGQIENWFNLDPRAHRRRFNPGAIRQRIARSRGIDSQELPDSADYAGHSTVLHVNPVDLEQLESQFMFGVRVAATQTSFGELLGHGRRLLQAVEVMENAVRQELGERFVPNRTSTLRDQLHVAFHTCDDARLLVENLEAQWARQFASPIAALLEGGLLLLIDSKADIALYEIIGYRGVDHIVEEMRSSGSAEFNFAMVGSTVEPESS